MTFPCPSPAQRPHWHHHSAATSIRCISDREEAFVALACVPEPGSDGRRCDDAQGGGGTDIMSSPYGTGRCVRGAETSLKPADVAPDDVARCLCFRPDKEN